MARDWDHTTDKINRGVPFERQPAADNAVLQAGIDAAMREVIRSPYNPNALRRPEKVGVTNAPNVVDAGEPKQTRGWVEPKELEPVVKPGSMEERVIEGMINAAYPHGTASPLRKSKAEGK
jgi:hypothetical protein